MSNLPSRAKVVIIGAGIHGLSTAWHLSQKYKNENDVVVLEKSDVAAGASGIACGVVRNNYFQPAMRELMAHSVEVWESDPKAFKYNPVGYLQISPEIMHKDVASIYEQQHQIFLKQPHHFRFGIFEINAMQCLDHGYRRQLLQLLLLLIVLT